MRPIKTRLIVSQTFEDEKTSGGIVLPETTRKALPEGTVFFVGDDITEVSPGDKIAFNGYAGTHVIIEGKPYVVLEESDILVIFSQEAPRE